MNKQQKSSTVFTWLLFSHNGNTQVETMLHPGHTKLLIIIIIKTQLYHITLYLKRINNN